MRGLCAFVYTQVAREDARTPLLAPPMFLHTHIHAHVCTHTQLANEDPRAPLSKGAFPRKSARASWSEGVGPTMRLGHFPNVQQHAFAADQKQVRGCVWLCLCVCDCVCLCLCVCGCVRAYNHTVCLYLSWVYVCGRHERSACTLDLGLVFNVIHTKMQNQCISHL